MLKGLLGWLAKVLTGDVVGRAFDVIDKKFDNENDRVRLKAEVTKTWLQNRTALPWWLDAFFIVPLGLYWAGVLFFSMWFCSACIFPQEWIVAGIPTPMDDWAGWIILSRFGAGIVSRFGK